MALNLVQCVRNRLVMGLAAVVCLGLTTVVHAAGQQDPAVVQAQAERFLKKQTGGLPGKVTFQVVAPRATLPACSAFDAFQPAGSRSMGKTTVGVRCLAPARWTVYLAAQVHVIGSYVVTREPLPSKGRRPFSNARRMPPIG